MPELLPFPGIRYGPAAGEPSDLLAPPYDVIDEREAEALRARSERNAVRLVLPEGEAPERYSLAATRLRDWLDQGVLVNDAPSVYVYRQTFQLDGKSFARRCLFAALRLSPFGDGAVLPHERTHKGPKADRLALTLACRAQLSPIFMIAGDPRGEVEEIIRTADLSGKPVLEATTPDGISHRLSRIEGELADSLCAVAGAEPLLIADGHHRYETALAVSARLPEVQGADFVLACVAGERDPGLLVLPTHRSLHIRPPGGEWESALSEAFEIERVASASPVELADRVASEDDGAMACLEPGAEMALVIHPQEEALRQADVAELRRKISTVAFDRLVLGEILGMSADEAAERGILSYHKDAAETLAAAGHTGAGFLVPPLPVDVIRNSVLDGGRLPAKSTYFAPKIPSGLLLRRL